MHKKNAGTWEGTVLVKEHNAGYGITIGLPAAADPKLHVRAYLIKGFFRAIFLGDSRHILGKSINLVPAAVTLSACAPWPEYKPPALASAVPAANR
jgi:hypothetical protein